jgi:predicted permease
VLRQLTRSLFHRAGSSTLIILMLAFAIGANTAIYSVAKAVIFAPLPFPRPDRLALIFESEGGRFTPGVPMISVRPGTFQDWHDQSQSFESMAAVQNMRATIMDADRASVTDGFRVGEGFFETLGVPARWGRYFTPSDYAPGGGPVVILADRFWRSRYNADPGIIGREIVLNGASNRVVGVMPPGFLPTISGNDPQYWVPLRWDPATKYSFVVWGFAVYARLKDGVTLAQATAEMEGVTAHMRAAHPNDYGLRAAIAPLDQYLFASHERLFALLLVAVGLVLLIACANVANLLLARAFERQREFAVRSALGASRVTILRQVLSESLVIALIGGLLGAALSPLLTRPALALLPPGNLPRLDRVEIDGNVLVFTTLISVLAGLLFGVFPAIRAGRGDLSLALRTGGRGSSLGKRERWLSDVLIVAEIAFSLVLLVGGGLLAQTFLKLIRTDPGFRPQQTVAVRLSIPSYRYGDYENGGKNVPRQQLYDRLDQSIGSIPSVREAGLTLKLPLRQFWNPDGVSIEGRAPVTGRNGSPAVSKRFGLPIHGAVNLQTVSPGYLGAIGTPIIRGRAFDDRDRANARMVAVVNEAFVRKFFPNEDPIERRIVVDRTSFAPRMTIVGVVGDARLDGMDQNALPEVFTAMAQLPSSDAWLVARAKGDVDSIGIALQKVVHDIDPEIGIVELTTMTSVMENSLWRERLSALLVGLFAALAALIATGGLYAVISHAVERRTQELGVRVALGASAVRIAQMVLVHGMRVTTIGTAIGALLMAPARRLLARQIYQTSDLPWMIAAVTCFLFILTLLSCWVPLRRALAVDPITALRTE